MDALELKKYDKPKQQCTNQMPLYHIKNMKFVLVEYKKCEYGFEDKKRR